MVDRAIYPCFMTVVAQGHTFPRACTPARRANRILADCPPPYSSQAPMHVSHRSALRAGMAALVLASAPLAA